MLERDTVLLSPTSFPHLYFPSSATEDLRSIRGRQLHIELSAAAAAAAAGSPVVCLQPPRELCGLLLGLLARCLAARLACSIARWGHRQLARADRVDLTLSPTNTATADAAASIRGMIPFSPSQLPETLEGVSAHEIAQGSRSASEPSSQLETRRSLAGQSQVVALEDSEKLYINFHMETHEETRKGTHKDSPETTARKGSTVAEEKFASDGWERTREGRGRWKRGLGRGSQSIGTTN